MSSSRTMRVTSWAGESCCSTLAPTACSLTRSVNSLDDRQRDVGFEQREADLAEGGFEVVLGQMPFAAQLLEDALDPLPQTLRTSDDLR